MPKKLAYLGASLAFAALAAPSLTFASSLSSTQVNSIISLLQAFGADSSTIASVETALTGIPTPTVSNCVDLSQDLTLGSTDATTSGQVSQLQSFLQSQGYFTYQGAKGYYGFITAQAVGQYQMAKGLVSSSADSAYGIVNAQTRGGMICAIKEPPATGFSASPTSGAAPLTVSFTSVYGGPVGVSTGYKVDFGDGSPARFFNCEQYSVVGTNDFCNNPVTITHTYAQPGAYTATFSDDRVVNTCGSDAGQLCSANMPVSKVLATQTITVSSGQTSSTPIITVTPVSGQAPLAVSFNVRNITWQPTPDGPPNNYQFVLGDGSIVGLTEGENYCSAGINASCTFGHTYMSAGTYTATLYAGKAQEGTPIGSVTIAVTGAQNQPSATIDTTFSHKDGTNSPIYVTGQASGANEVTVFLMPSNYLAQYGTSYAAAQSASLSGKDGFYSSAATVTNGRYMAGFNWQGVQTTFTVLVYDFASHALLATGTLTSPAPVVPGPVINTFYAAPSTVNSGTASMLFWSASNTAQCGISVLTPGAPGLDLTKAISNFNNSGQTAVTTGALTQMAEYELRCAPLTGSTAAYAVSDVWVNVQTALPVCPSNATAQRGQIGQTFKCSCPANSAQGSVWGSLYYTDDSNVCTAGAQAGQINLASGGEVDYTIDPGQGSYAGSTQYGITSLAWGSWPGSFQITGPKACLAAGTAISMADGGHKNIENIKVGDLVKSFIGAKTTTGVVTHVMQREDPIVTVNGTLKAAPDEIVYLVNGTTKTADQLKTGDRLFGEGGQEITVSTISSSSVLAKTYDFSLANGGAFFAYGYLVQALDPVLK